MESRSLMIGDWVYEDGIPQIVEDLSKFDGINGYGEDRYSPIPLTEERLEANGIKWSDIHCVFTDSHHFSFNREVDFGRVYNMDDDNHQEVMMPLKYVHELQRALRCCGLWDLANNFKV